MQLLEIMGGAAQPAPIAATGLQYIESCSFNIIFVTFKCIFYFTQNFLCSCLRYFTEETATFHKKFDVKCNEVLLSLFHDI